MKKIILLSAIFLSACTLSYAQGSAAYSQKLKEMLAVSGAEANFRAAIDQMIVMYKKQKPEVPLTVWDEFGNMFKKNISADLLTMLLPVYQKHLTEEDLTGITAFYKSPSGMKLAQESPLILQESMQVGQAWGMKLGEEFAKKLKEKGY